MLFLLLGILYYYFRIAFTVENRLFTILSIGFIFTGCVEAIWGLGQLYGLLPSFNSSFKITGSFYNPGPYSGYLAIVFPMAFYFLLNDFPKIFGNQGDKNTIVRFRWILSLLAFSLIVVILPAGMSRASWVAVIGGSIVVLFCYIRKEDNQWWRSFKERLSKKRIWLLFALLASLILCIFIMVGMYKLKIDSADGRLLIWKNTIQMIKDNPLGVGLGYFPGQYGDYQIAYFSSGKASAREDFLAGRPDYAFNEFIQITAESGIIGLLLFVSIVIVGMLNAFRQRKLLRCHTRLAYCLF